MPTNQTPLIGIYQNQPTNINFLIMNRFRLVMRRAPSCVYFVQTCNLPGFNMDNATQATSFVQLPVPGDRIHYNDFVFTFPVDEDLRNYREIADWIIGLGFPKQFGQYADLANSLDGVESDIGLIILDSDQQPKHIVSFHNAFPVSITDLNFNTKAQDTELQMVTVTFKYGYWQFDEVNGISESDGSVQAAWARRQHRNAPYSRVGLSDTVTPADQEHNP